MPTYSIHSGKRVVRDIYKQTAMGTLKSWLAYWFFKVAYLGAVTAFVFAGAVSAHALTVFNGF